MCAIQEFMIWRKRREERPNQHENGLAGLHKERAVTNTGDECDVKYPSFNEEEEARESIEMTEFEYTDNPLVSG